MTKCSFKNCKNCSRTALKKDGVSYFVFPRDPIRYAEWISVIARERGEQFYKPSQGSVVCSAHFLESDLYTTQKGFKKLHKTAVPRIDTNGNEEDCCIDKETCLLHRQGKDEQVNENAVILKKKAKKDRSFSTSLSIRSILDTPVTRSLEKALQACRMLLRKKNKIIDNLRKKNARLKKKCNKLQNIMSTMPPTSSKRKTMDHSLSQYMEVVIVEEDNTSPIQDHGHDL